MPTPLLNALTFLLNSIFDVYIGVLILRFLLAAIRIDYFNPYAQIIIRLTKFIINPLRKIIPNIRNIETSTLLVILFFEILKFYCMRALSGIIPRLGGIVILAFADFLTTFINIIFYAVIVQAILSWVPNLSHSPLAKLVNRLTKPFLRPFQRRIPLISGIDFSPLFLLVCIKFIEILCVVPIYNVASNFL